ncbi:hypothetical protein EMPS_02296 [Entomortierella parvispora]|uniref:Arm-like repeat domain-containing protein n=1 Tax=Entomortierella parvispora TaxID=205924 RepID=A0A9P3H561_9FUNG|nr:hypothetical protein EMPS_02296 [Entomortierella parvispora]
MTKSPPPSKPPLSTKSHTNGISSFGQKKSIAAALLSIGYVSVSIAAPLASKSSKARLSSKVLTTPSNSTSTAIQTGLKTHPSSDNESSDSRKATHTLSSLVMDVASDIFSANASRIKQDIHPPKVGEDIKTTAQLATCAELLPKIPPKASKDLALSSKDICTDGLSPSQITWIKEMKDHPLEKIYILQLLSRMVDRFINLPIKTSDDICEVILLGPVLDKQHYQALINEFLHQLQSKIILNPDLLQGLVSLIECAPPFHLRVDDLMMILRVIRQHLADSTQKDTLYTIHLTAAISRVLVIMVDCGVKDLNREQEHEPLLETLSKFRKHTDPLVRYHVEYACRALQLIPDDETVRQGFTRNAIGFAGGLMTVAGVIQLDFGGIPEGLPVLIKSGQGLVENLKKYFGYVDKNPWFQAVREAEAMAREGLFVDFNRLVCEVNCRQDPFFQWGICLILGEVAIDQSWDATVHEQAVKLLGEMFRAITGSDQHQDVRSWILTLLHDISEPRKTDPSTSTDNDEIRKQAFDMALKFKGAVNEKASPLEHSHHAMTFRRLPALSKLLKQIDHKPDIELALDRLRRYRQELYDRHAVYVAPMSKLSLDVSDEDSEFLKERVFQFLEGSGLVMLILGDSGAGKSTFNARLEQDLWVSYKAGGRIPLLIDLKAIRDLNQNLILQHLDSTKMFAPSHLSDLRRREFILICDGYDESQCRSNLHTNSQFNRTNQWKAKMVISCRTQYLTRGYQTSFAPQQDAVAHLDLPSNELFMEAVIVPFKLDQIKDYVEQYTASREPGDNEPRRTTEQYLEQMETVNDLMDLVKNPFMLKTALEILPSVASTTSQITRVELYDSFVNFYFRNELDRLKEQLSRGKMGAARLAAFQEMEPLNFTDLCIDFSKRLAAAIVGQGEEIYSVEYGSLADSTSWKSRYFGSEPKTLMLMEASQLVRRTRALTSQVQIRGRRRPAESGETFKFSHLSILEYFYALSIYDPKEGLPRLDSSPTDNPDYLADHPLGRQSFTKQPAIIQFLADRAQYIDDFKDHLHSLIRLSKDHKSDTPVSCAAANAITILIRAGERFNGVDLRGIRVPGAVLSCGDFDSAQLQGADLRNTTLCNVWLHQADMSFSRMEGVSFGDCPCLEVEKVERHPVFSPDGKYFAVGLHNDTVTIYCTSSWKEVLSLKNAGGLTNEPSGDGDEAASGDESSSECEQATGAGDKTSGGGDVAASGSHDAPSDGGEAIGDDDKTSGDGEVVQLQEAQNGALDSSLREHTSLAVPVAFSSNGHQIVSGCGDAIVRLWDAQTGTLIFSLNGHTDGVTSVAFSHDDNYIVSGSKDATVRLWDAQTGVPVFFLSGHTDTVNSVIFSPSGHQIASASNDGTVRLWHAETGTLVFSLSNHADGILSVAYLPNGKEIATGGADGMVQLWDAETGDLKSSLIGHTGWVTSVAFSPKCDMIASGSDDNSVRLWDLDSGHCLYKLVDFDDATFGIAWKETCGDLYLVVGGSAKSVRSWKITKDEGEVKVYLNWRSAPDTLVLVNASIQGVQDLSEINSKLMQQRRAIGGPITL